MRESPSSASAALTEMEAAQTALRKELFVYLQVPEAQEALPRDTVMKGMLEIVAALRALTADMRAARSPEK